MALKGTEGACLCYKKKKGGRILSYEPADWLSHFSIPDTPKYSIQLLSNDFQ